MAKRKKDKLRVAFIGSGGIAGAHMRYYKDMEDVEMVAASDVVAESVQSRCEEYEIAEAYTDYKKMLRRGQARCGERLYTQWVACAVYDRRAQRRGACDRREAVGDECARGAEDD